MGKAKQVSLFRVMTGMNVPGKRLEPGDVTDAIPESSVGWLLGQGHIEAESKTKAEED